MDKQIIIVCDEEGKLTGEYIAKEKGHLGKGQRHLAITILLFNNQGQVLLQKRKHKVFDDIWDLTGATHPLHLKNGHDETFEEATLRCLKREYGIEAEEVKNLKNLGTFNYFAEYEASRPASRDVVSSPFSAKADKDGLCEHEAQPLLCENEHCAMLTGEYNGQLNLNPEVGYEYKWMEKQDFLKDIQQNPQKYSPWAKKGVKLLD